MGELEGIKGAWGYVEGGMGNVSHAIKNCAVDHGADVFCDKVRRSFSSFKILYFHEPMCKICEIITAYT